ALARARRGRQRLRQPAHHRRHRPPAVLRRVEGLRCGTGCQGGRPELRRPARPLRAGRAAHPHRGTGRRGARRARRSPHPRHRRRRAHLAGAGGRLRRRRLGGGGRAGAGPHRPARRGQHLPLPPRAGAGAHRARCRAGRARPGAPRRPRRRDPGAGQPRPGDERDAQGPRRPAGPGRAAAAGAPRRARGDGRRAPRPGPRRGRGTSACRRGGARGRRARRRPVVTGGQRRRRTGARHRPTRAARDAPGAGRLAHAAPLRPPPGPGLSGLPGTPGTVPAPFRAGSEQAPAHPDVPPRAPRREWRTSRCPDGEILPTPCLKSITNVLRVCGECPNRRSCVCTVTAPRRVPRHAHRHPGAAAARQTHPGGTLKTTRTAQPAAALAAGSLHLAACTSPSDDDGDTGTTGDDATQTEDAGGDTGTESTAKADLGDIQTVEGNIFYSTGQDEFTGYNSKTADTYSTYNNVIMDRILPEGFFYFGTDGTIYENEHFGTAEVVSGLEGDDPLVIEYTVADDAVWS